MTTASLSQRISRLEGARPGELQTLLICWDDGEPPFAEIEVRKK